MQFRTCWDPVFIPDKENRVQYAVNVGNHFSVSEWSYIEGIVGLNRKRSKMSLLYNVRPSSVLASQLIGFQWSTALGKHLSAGLFTGWQWYYREELDNSLELQLSLRLSLSEQVKLSWYNTIQRTDEDIHFRYSALQMHISISEMAELYLRQEINLYRGRSCAAIDLRTDKWAYTFSVRSRPFRSGFSLSHQTGSFRVTAGFNYQLLAGFSPNIELINQ